jgi:alanine racemase
MQQEMTSLPHENGHDISRMQVWAHVDLGRLSDNIRTVRRLAGDKPKLMAVVKSDAYGHGAVRVAQHALANGVSELAVAHPAEGAELRAAGIAAPILILGLTPPEEADTVIRTGLIPSVCTLDAAQALARAAVQHGRTVPVHVRIDIGLGSVGLRPHEAAGFAAQLAGMTGLCVTGLFTHLPSAYRDEPAAVASDMRRFHAAAEQFAALGLPRPRLHAASSAAVTRFAAETALDMVRPGIMLYGLPPLSSPPEPQLNLQPIMRLQARIVFLKQLEAGTLLGYDGQAAKERMIVATLPIGYGDGMYFIHIAGGEVLIRGQRAPIIGKPLMDHMMVDVTGLPGVKAGDIATLIGEDGDDCITAREIADKCGIDTGHTDCITMLSRRVPRIYSE